MGRRIFNADCPRKFLAITFPAAVMNLKKKGFAKFESKILLILTKKNIFNYRHLIGRIQKFQSLS